MYRITIFLFCVVEIGRAFSVADDANSKVSVTEETQECPVNSHYVFLSSNKKCPLFGCLEIPLDIESEHVRNSLTQLRYSKDFTVEEKHSNNFATLTLKGYKGERVATQVNQDRAFVISDFIPKYSVKKKYDNNQGFCISNDHQESQLLGVFDGHGDKGEVVSQHSVEQIPLYIYENIVRDGDDDEIKKTLTEAFHYANATVPPSVPGGATASIVLQLGSKVYIANAGDSRSFIASVNNLLEVQVIYISEEDKPDLPRERRRIESTKDGEVFAPGNGRTSRVYYKNRFGTTVGLAMSRSIGDWDGSKAGVIATPTIDVVSLHDYYSSTNQCSPSNNNDNSDSTDENSQQCSNDNDGAIRIIGLFAVSATDGLLDIVDVQSIAQTIANSLYSSTTNKDNEMYHPLNACEDLIITAAEGWGKQYRDDIAIAISNIPIPNQT